MESSENDSEPLTPELGRPISTIDEDYYNSIGNTYISDTEDDASDASSDTPVPFLSPSASASPTTEGEMAESQDLSSNKKVPIRNDSLLISERSNGTKDSSSKRDNTSGSKNDLLLMSERSIPSHNSISRRDASGYDSLLVSETTDETWKRMVAYPEDDASSLSTTHSTPFPHLLEDSNSHMAPSPPAVSSLSGHDAETAKKCGRGSHNSNRSKSGGKPLSDRIIETIERPPLASISSTPTDPDSASSVPTAINITENYNDSHCPVGNEDASIEGQNNRDFKATLQNSGDPSPSDRNETGEIKLGNKAIQALKNNQSDVSSIGTSRINGRGDHIPRRWLFDRIDGTVKVSDEEEEQLPQWKRKPPNFLCLPSPLLGLLPWLLEENFCCISVGKWGFFGNNDTMHTKTMTHGVEPEQSSNTPSTNDGHIAKSREKADFRRTLVIVHAYLLNVCGIFATIISGLSLTRSSASLLETAPFGKATVIPTTSSPGTLADDDGPVILYLGLLSLGVDNPRDTAGGSVLVGFRDFCDTAGMEQFVSEKDCNSCSDTSLWIVAGYFLATMAYLPLFVIGISRLYKNYDANCSKVTAGIWSVMSIFGYLLVLSCYYFSCLNSLYDGDILYIKGGAVYDGMVEIPEEDHVRADFEWKVGVGQILFLIGLVLKLIDFVCNCCIATPAITRSRELQWEYEENLSLHGEKVENGNTPEGSAVEQTQLGGSDGLNSDINPVEQNGNV